MRTVFNQTEFQLTVELVGLPPIIVPVGGVYQVPAEYIGPVRVVCVPENGRAIMVRG